MSVHMCIDHSLRELYSAMCINLRMLQNRLQDDRIVRPAASPLAHNSETKLKAMLESVEHLLDGLDGLSKDLREVLK